MKSSRLVLFALFALLVAGRPAVASRHRHTHHKPSSQQIVDVHSSQARPSAFAGTGNLFVEPAAGVTPVVRLLDGATKSVDVEVYLLTDRDVLAALERAHARGVTVRVMLEPHPYGGGPGNREAFDRLAQDRIAAIPTRDRFHYTHEKAIVIDRARALISSANFTHAAFTHNREYAYLDTNPQDVREIEAIFDADWQRHDVSPHEADLVVAPDNARAKLLGLIRSATHTLAVQDEECSDPEVIAALQDRERAGVRVTVQLQESRDVKRLLQKGLPAKRMHGLYLHAKAIVADGARAYIGSVNLTANSMDHNRELGILLTDPTLVGAIDRIVQADWTR
ncbi:MAG TPA: phospholipase D-like domain-containing protein [Oscillatoriaceae cyanobacterium]